jgi:S-adenosylmethionine synthetase
MNRYLTAESVCQGHPDKLCDRISDAILDSVLDQNPNAHVACEVMATGGDIILAGEITCGYVPAYNTIVGAALCDIGYNPDDFKITNLINRQSPDIAGGVSHADGEIGAGDQGTMYGYATNETAEKLPLPLVLAHRICERLDFLRKEKMIDGLLPDGKAQVTVEYDFGVPVRVKNVVVSVQHREDISEELLRRIVTEKVLPGAFLSFPLDADTEILVNPSGRFVLGGPAADTGLTGRKIIVDTYGGFAPHGGGAFSGKDPTKVDRSAAYAARYIAKNIVAAKLADRCKVAISYAIGVAEPVAVDIDTFCTGTVSDEILSSVVREIFDLRPAEIIRDLDLAKPIYAATSAYGHFGRDGFTWEKTDKTAALLEAVKRRHTV